MENINFNSKDLLQQLEDITVTHDEFCEIVKRNTTSLWEDKLECTTECVVIEETNLEMMVDDNYETKHFTGFKDAYNKLTEAVERRMPIRITKKSVITGKTSVLMIYARLADVNRWNNGALVQDALHYLDPATREFLISGMTPSEQEEYFSRGHIIDDDYEEE